MRTCTCQAAPQGPRLSAKGPDKPATSRPPQSEATAQNALSLLSAHSSSSEFSHHTFVPPMSTRVHSVPGVSQGGRTRIDTPSPPSGGLRLGLL